jgi:glutamyl-tRNA synthetase
VAWLAARSAGIDFIVRMEDLDRVTSSTTWEFRQLADLAAIGLDWDGEVVRQSDRFDRYRAVLADVRMAERVYPCYCTRREIRAEIDAAVSAPHGHVPDGAYPGTCRDLTWRERARRERAGRVPAWRLRTEGESFSLTDAIAGDFTGGVDDFVLERSDGIPAYNLAVVIDDIAQGVTQVVRGDDLLNSTPRHLLLQQIVGAAPPSYYHVPLVVEADGTRLAKRDRAVTLADLATVGIGPAEVLSALAWSLDLAERGEPVSASQLVDRFDISRVPRRPIRIDDLFPAA